MRLRNNPKAVDILKENSELVIVDVEKIAYILPEVFIKKQPLYLEIGMGKGDFIYEMAQRNPDINFIGIEKYPSVLAIAVNKINKKAKLPNLKLMYYDAGKLEDVFTDNQIDKIYLNFSDPWPKKRHQKRRLTYKSFLDLYQKILIPQGDIEIKTDNQILFEYNIMAMNNYGMIIDYISLDFHKSVEAKDNVQTEYERKFSLKGPIYKLIAHFK